jgi:hypothetical protein
VTRSGSCGVEVSRAEIHNQNSGHRKSLPALLSDWLPQLSLFKIILHHLCPPTLHLESTTTTAISQSATMARPRVKKRPHAGPQSASSTSQAHGTRSPKSMVIRVGASEVGPHITQLVKDVRLMMEPDTAGRLKVWPPSVPFPSCKLHNQAMPLLTQRTI